MTATTTLHRSIDDDPIERRVSRASNDDRHAVLAAQMDLSEKLKHAGLEFEGRAYPVSIRPLAIPARLAKSLANSAEHLVTLLHTAANLYFEDPAVRGLFAHCDSVAPYITRVPGLNPLATICRLDAMLGPDGQYRIVETNAECPGGVIQSGLATRIWGHTPNPLTRGLDVDEAAQPFVVNPDLFCHVLLQTHTMLAGTRPKHAAVVNFKGRFTNEVPHIVSTLARLGVKAFALDVGELRGDLRSVTAPDGTRIDLIYAKMDPRELFNEPAAEAYLKATAAGNVTCINSLVSQYILADKAILAVLSDSKFSANFTAADREVIRAHVPWTRLVKPGPTQSPSGKTVDLLDYAVENQRSLVLKPSNATRGEHTIVGPMTSAQEWAHWLGGPVKSSPYVVQEYLPGTKISVPNPTSGAMDTMTAGLDIYVFAGRFAGFHARGSLDPVINIGKRGVLLPVAVVRDQRHD
jgi:diaminobutyrate-2-oxoglutarate transaminase